MITVLCKGAATWPAGIADRGQLGLWVAQCKLFVKDVFNDLGALYAHKVVVRDHRQARGTGGVLPNTDGLKVVKMAGRGGQQSFFAQSIRVEVEPPDTAAKPQGRNGAFQQVEQSARVKIRTNRQEWSALGNAVCDAPALRVIGM